MPRPLRHLDLSGNELGSGWAALRVALSTSAGRSVTTLTLGGQAAVCLHGLDLPALEQLEVPSCGLAGVLGHASPGFPRLKRLDASENEEALRGLAPGLLPPSLEVLDLSGCCEFATPLPPLPAGLRELRLAKVLGLIVRRIPPLPALELLVLRDCGLAALPEALVSGGFPALAELDVSLNRPMTELLLPLPVTAPLLAKLNLSGVRLASLVDVPLLQFTALTELDLSFNPLLRDLPPLPPRLERLRMEGCRRLRALPALPPKLKSLALTDNAHIAGVALPPDLEMLRLSGCQLAREVDLGCLENLRVLDLSSTEVDEVELPCLPRLEALDLHFCDLTALPDAATLFPQLRELNLAGSAGLEAVDPQMRPLERLEVLRLDDCWLKAFSANAATLFPRLRELYLAGSPALGAIDPEMRPLERLEVLSVALCGLTALPANAATLFPRLRELDASSSDLGAFNPDMRPLEHVEVLNVVACALTTLAGIGALFPRLRRLDVGDNPRLAELGPVARLEELRMYNCAGFTALPDVDVLFPRLRTLDVGDNPQMRIDRPVPGLALVHAGNVPPRMFPGARMCTGVEEFEQLAWQGGPGRGGAGPGLNC